MGENFNCRLQREKAKTGALSASLAWNDPSDLDLHAIVLPDQGGRFEICYRTKVAADGYLDVDMHARDGEEVPEPVENIFWKEPPAGVYSIRVQLYKKRGSREAPVPFRVLLKRDGEETLSREGAVEYAAGHQSVECFRFTVDREGLMTMGSVGAPLPDPKPLPSRARAEPAPMKAARTRRGPPAMKAMQAIKRASTIACGKKAKVAVWQGKKLKTKKGLRKEDLMKSRSGKIVSIKKSKQGAESKWCKATAQARAIKGYTGFKAIKKGTSFYEKARELAAEM